MICGMDATRSIVNAEESFTLSPSPMFLERGICTISVAYCPFPTETVEGGALERLTLGGDSDRLVRLNRCGWIGHGVGDTNRALLGPALASDHHTDALQHLDR